MRRWLCEDKKRGPECAGEPRRETSNPNSGRPVRADPVGISAPAGAGYEPRFHPPQAFFSYLTWMDNLTDQLAQYDPAFANEFRRCREGLLDSLLRKEDASGDH